MVEAAAVGYIMSTMLIRLPRVCVVSFVTSFLVRRCAVEGLDGMGRESRSRNRRATELARLAKTYQKTHESSTVGVKILPQLPACQKRFRRDQLYHPCYLPTICITAVHSPDQDQTSDPANKFTSVYNIQDSFSEISRKPLHEIALSPSSRKADTHVDVEESSETKHHPTT